ncbi:unnamed protein product [Effrenium voratum]|nr:unnamed protein product [Effrenium voratum]
MPRRLPLPEAPLRRPAGLPAEGEAIHPNVLVRRRTKGPASARLSPADGSSLPGFADVGPPEPPPAEPPEPAPVEPLSGGEAKEPSPNTDAKEHEMETVEEVKKQLPKEPKRKATTAAASPRKRKRQKGPDSDPLADAAPADAALDDLAVLADLMPVGLAPADSASDLAPAHSAPADSAASDSAPAHSPADSAPADSAPADSAPADSVPAESAPADSGPADSAEEVEIELEDPELGTASLRVPRAAAQAVRKESDAFQTELGVTATWCESEADVVAEQMAEMQEMTVGTEVRARYGWRWFDATITEADPFSDEVQVRWKYDGSTSTLGLKDLQLSEELEQRRKRRAWLRSAWQLWISGPARARKIAVARVMGKAEQKCPGLWSGDLLEAAEELRGAGKDASADIKLVSFSEAGLGAACQTLQPGLRGLLRRAGDAAGCYLQLLGDAAVLVVGSKEERERGADCLCWKAAEKLSRTSPVSGDMSDASEVSLSWTHGRDRVQLQLDGSLDLLVNGHCQIRNLVLVLGTASELYLAGQGVQRWLPAPQEVVLRALRLYHHAPIAAKPPGVTILETTVGQTAWLEPVDLRAIEVDCKTMVVAADSCGRDNWTEEAPSRLLVCGGRRAVAAERLAALLAGIAERTKEAAEAARLAGRPAHAFFQLHKSY